MTPSFLLDGTYRRHDRVVIAGSPLRLFRLSAAGTRVVESIERGQPPPAGHDKLTDRLVEAGAIHPVHGSSPFTAADVTMVVPAYNAQPSLADRSIETIVVDDASDPPLATVQAWRTIRLPTNQGPGAARNAGLAAVTTPLVAFVDTDVELPEQWLEPLLLHFADPAVALVAPRVASAAGASAIAHYEAARSPLDMGSQPGRVAAGTRLSYVPAAALLVRTDALRAIGGFDEGMRSGEDVDMVWRLNEAGHRCRYEPEVIVRHRPRTTFSAWIRQRISYGRSSAMLDRRHPGSVAPLRMSGWSAAVWLLVFGRRPMAAAAVAAGTIVALRRKLDDLPAEESIRLAGLGHLYAGRQVASAITRAWWPLALVAAVSFPRSRMPLLGAAVVPALLDWLPRRTLDNPARYVALRVADDISFGAGVWIGAVEQRSVGALAPRFTSWPGRPTD